MASLRTFAARRASTPSFPSSIFLYRSFLQQRHGSIPSLCRLGHTQSLWEELLGRKIEASTAKKLEDAFLQYKVEKAIPSWLPFFPHCSFWIPSHEDTMKNLQVLAQRINESRAHSSKETSKARKSAIHLSNGINDCAISSVVWSLVPHIESLLAHIEASTVDSASQNSPTSGTFIEVVLENNDDRDGSAEIEDDTNKKQKS